MVTWYGAPLRVLPTGAAHQRHPRHLQRGLVPNTQFSSVCGYDNINVLSSYAAPRLAGDERPRAVSSRSRRCGPRSLAALHLRKRCAPIPPCGGSCQSEPEPQNSSDIFTIMHANVYGFCSHRAEIEIQCSLAGFRSLVALNETFLDSSVGCADLCDYALISRLDRRAGGSFGGICLFAKTCFASSVAHVGDSDKHERSWHILHCDAGPILVGVWYRPPCYGETDSIMSFREEYLVHSHECIGCIVVGDLNVHHTGWLRHSSNITPEGRCLAAICRNHGLRQLVQQPTRGKYLLD